MFKHVLIPTDGSRVSAKAVKAGIALAREMGARVTGYHGVGAPPYGYYGEPIFVDERLLAEAERAVLAAGEQHVAKIAKAARGAGVPFEPLVARTAATYEGILDAARKRKCDVIFMASHGRRGVKRLVLGSVTQQVLTHSTIPVLVYRIVPGVAMFKHILIPTDGSSVALKAAKAGIRLAAEIGARVTAFFAIEAWQPQLYGEGYGIDLRTFQSFERAAREAGERHVDAVAKLAKAAGVPFASLVGKAATPYEAIVDAASKRKCDVIFMASHGRRGLSKLMMGSVTQKVLSHTKVPVLVYR